MIKGKRRGFDPGIPGTLYVLQSGCGTMVKIGISNKPDQRYSYLRHWTPFALHRIALIHHDDGGEIAQLEREFHAKMVQAQFYGGRFEGYTEWMEWDDRLLGWLHDCAPRGFAVSVADGIKGLPRNGKPYMLKTPEEERRAFMARIGSLFGK